MNYSLYPERNRRPQSAIRVTRTRSKTTNEFVRDKNVNLTGRVGNLKIVNAQHELKSIRSEYNKFLNVFQAFHARNDPSITGTNLSSFYLSFKNSCDNLLKHCSMYYNQSRTTRRIGRFSPLIEFSQNVLSQWSKLIIIMNNFNEIDVLPHLQKINNDFQILTKNVMGISKSIVTRTYYKSGVNAAANQIRGEINQANSLIINILSNGDSLTYPKERLERMKGEMQILSKRINVDYISLLPSSVSVTAENTRIRNYLKSACGDISAMIEAGFYFRSDVKYILKHMKSFDTALRDLLDDIGVVYRLDVSPDDVDMHSDYEEEEQNQEQETPEENEPFYVQVPEARPPRVTSKLFRRTIRNRTSLKPLKTTPDVSPRVSSQNKNRTSTKPGKPFLFPHKMAQTQPNPKLKKFLFEMGSTLGLSLTGDENDQIEAVERAVKERLRSQSPPSPKQSHESFDQQHDQHEPREHDVHPTERDNFEIHDHNPHEQNETHEIHEVETDAFEIHDHKEDPDFTHHENQNNEEHNEHNHSNEENLENHEFELPINHDENQNNEEHKDHIQHNHSNEEFKEKHEEIKEKHEENKDKHEENKEKHEDEEDNHKHDHEHPENISNHPNTEINKEEHLNHEHNHDNHIEEQHNSPRERNEDLQHHKEEDRKENHDSDDFIEISSESSQEEHQKDQNHENKSENDSHNNQDHENNNSPKKFERPPALRLNEIPDTGKSPVLIIQDD